MSKREAIRGTLRGQVPPWLVFTLLAALTVLVYLPSLRGAYIFDDGYYFVDNTDVHVTSLDAGEWVRAALSQAGANQFRALGMLSFAANYYFSGLDPFWPKLTNLCLHLLNGTLLYLLLCRLFELQTLTRSNADTSANVATRRRVVAAIIAGAWLLLPINLTAVAYVSQRLESLANVFVILGKLIYLRARTRDYVGTGGAVMLSVSILIFTILGLAAKESAVVLPLYTACIEFAIARFRKLDGSWSRGAIVAHGLFLALPFLAGLIWITQWDFSSVAHVRTFTIGERLLTEPRVLVHYIVWTLLPNLSQLTFYHDDFVLSRSLIDPPTTIAAIALLLALAAAALWQKDRRPLFCLGVLWFFSGHVVTATIIPLELVFEHRNYFPSMGLLLAVASLMALEPLGRMAAAKVAATCSLVALYAFTTYLRAEEWSHPLRLALAEADKRPQSMRAQYELARTLILAAGTDEQSQLITEAERVLQNNAFRPDSGITALQALIFLRDRAHQPTDPALWETLVEKLRQGPPSQSDVDALIFLFRCQLRGQCTMQPQHLLDAFTAALDSSGGDARLMSAYADFAYIELGDAQLAETMMREVVRAKPSVHVYRSNLINLLVATRQFDAADAELRLLESLDRYGSLKTTIADLRKEIDIARSTPSPVPDSSLPTGEAKP